MGPHGAGFEEIREAVGVDRAPDQVKRRQEFVRRHPEVSITSPRENGTSGWLASWVGAGASPDDDGAVNKVMHDSLRFLLDSLEDRFGHTGGNPDA